MWLRKTLLLTLILLGSCILINFIFNITQQPATASEPTPSPGTEPTPTPTPGKSTSQDTPTDTLCHLASGQTCTFINPLDIAISNTSTRIYPALAARQVPTYTWVSIMFDRDINTNTLNPNTFYLRQGSTFITGTTRYITSGKTAIFQPNTPLDSNTTYTATLTPDIKDLAGLPLMARATKVWTFTTVSDRSSLELLSTRNMVAAANMNIYFGDLHSHTSYSDGQGTPVEAYAMARASGLDFFSLSEHAFLLTDAEWQDILNQADTATLNGHFVALPGFEYTHTLGHINIFGSDTYINRNDPNYDTLDEFYAWLVEQPDAIGQFNHPGDRNENFNNFAYRAVLDHKIVLQELTNATQFFMSIKAGWHLGTLKNRDTHSANWGCCPLMGVVAANLTPESILEALAAKRTFFVSPSDANLALVMQANGYWMGSAIPEASNINFVINAYDPNPTGQPLRVYIYDNGVRVVGTTLPSQTNYSWTPTIAAQLGHYYYVETYYDGWHYPAYSSPIWVEHNPIAEAGPAQIAAINASITLNGSQSWDPERNSLTYHWTQTSGPPVSLHKAQTAHPTFTTTLKGTFIFRLKVIDPGSLSSFDTTSVTSTDKPILSISKSGPATVNVGDPITYSLTVVNNGFSDAFGVVVTDAIPHKATYISGGKLMPSNVVSWHIPKLTAEGGISQVTFVVTATESLFNNKYGAACNDCIPAVGLKAVITNGLNFFLPIILKYR